ncbi:MAG: cadherin domain-containing protein, partial [Opitutae bacterium]
HDNDEIGTEVGTVVPSDPNPGQDLFVYVIEPTHKFRVDGDKLITTTTFNSEELQSQPLVLRTVDDGGLFTDTEFNLSVLPPNRAPSITTRESITIDEDSFFRMATSGDNVLKFDDDATDTEQVEVTFTVTDGGIYFFKNTGITFTDGEAGSGYMKFRGTLKSVNARMDRLTYNPPEDFNGQVTWTIEISDLGNHQGNVPLTASHTLQITINAVNDPPVVTVPEGKQNLLEDASLKFNILQGNPITVKDDPENEKEIGFTLSTNEGSLSLARTRNLTFTTGDGIGDASMSFTGTTTAINSALNGLTYDPPADFDGTSTISFLTEDFGNVGAGGAKTAESSLEVSILPVNDTPVITGPSLVPLTEDLPHIFNSETDSLFSIVDDAANASKVEGGQPGSVTTQLGVRVQNGTVRMSQLQGLTFLKGDSAGDSDLLMTGSFNLIKNALNGMTYTSNENYNGADTLTIEFNDMGHFGDGIAQTVSSSALLLVSPANDAPTDVTISPSFVDENKSAGTTVGKLAAIDPDAGDSHTFKIIGPADNMPPFTITGNTLKTTRALNAEEESLIEVMVSATDAAGAEFLKDSLWISVRNLNDPPTGITIDNDSVLEGEPSGTLVGNLSSIDSDGTLGRGLVGYWPFDDAQGDMVSDLRYAGDSNNGTIHNASPTMWKTGKIGFALELDGSKRFVEIPHNDRYLVDAGTFTIWYKHTNGSGGLFSKDSTGYDTGGHIYMNMNDSRLQVRLQGVNTANTISMNSASA